MCRPSDYIHVDAKENEMTTKIHGLCCDCTPGDLGSHCEGHLEDGLTIPCVPCPNDPTHLAAPDYDHTYYCRDCGDNSGWGSRPGPVYQWPMATGGGIA